MILLDANILLEMIIIGRPQRASIFRWMEQNKEPYCISMLTVHLALYFGLKDNLTISDLKTFLSNYPKIAILPEDYVEAMKILKNRDHEDALQLAVAERIGCTYIVTLDHKFSSVYSDRIKFINPA